MAGIFEKPDAFDPVGEMEALRFGRFGLLHDEIEKIRRQAEENGRDPDEAVRIAEEKMNQATGRLREKQGEATRKSLKKGLERGAK